MSSQVQSKGLTNRGSCFDSAFVTKGPGGLIRNFHSHAILILKHFH